MKRLKLRKEVKVITTLLSFGLLCTAVPTINAVAEDAGTEENTVETNTVDETTTEETTTDETVIDDDAVVEEQVVEEVESPESDLYTRLMNTTTVEEFDAVANTATDEEIALLTEEQNNDIQTHYDSFEVSEEIIEDTVEVIEVQDDEPIPSEIIYPTVNFSNVAPLVNSVGQE